MLDKAQALTPELIRIRRDIHQHPELSFQEFRTAQLVADTLSELGIEPQKDIGRTGVTAQIGNGDGPTIAIRADMDALPITEKNDLPFKSQNPGVMHACGHDAHTAILLGAAHLLKQSLAEDNWHPAGAREAIRRILDIAEGKVAMEFIMKDISTVRYKPQRLWEWSKIVMEEIAG